MEVSMFPLIPLIAMIAIVGGGVTLAWYNQLSQEEQEAANRIACDYARQLYNKSLEELTKAQANHVAHLTKQHFTN
jgi:hypothetical protein